MWLLAQHLSINGWPAAQQSKGEPDAWIRPKTQDTPWQYFLILIQAFGPVVFS